MISVLSCIAFEHSPLALLLATTICVFGAYLTVRLYSRTRRCQGPRKFGWLFISAVASGSAIWTTHYVAMLGFDAPYSAHESVPMIVSLFLAIAFSGIGISIASASDRGVAIEIGGFVFGGGIAVMHYTGMSAYQIGGHTEWDLAPVIISVVLGVLFGGLAFNRVARPVTKYCRYSGVAALVLAIVTLHFTGMSAMTIVPDPTIELPPQLMSDTILMLVVVGVCMLIVGTGAVSILIDSTSEREANERYRHMALHDGLTGVANRFLLNEHLERMIGGGSSTGRVAIFALDLDRFKEINDVHGHLAGDQVLKTIAERLSASSESDELIARVGGDEFVILKPEVFAKSQATSVADRICAAIEQPIPHGDKLYSVRASCGIAFFPDHGTTSDQLLGRADLAMYRAKNHRRDRHCFYDASMDEKNRDRSALAMDLHHAIERDELELYYQPQKDVAGGDVVGFEVLLRWKHPERGFVSPGEFIPLAEEIGLIIPIGTWVLRTACAEAASWNTPYKIAVNAAAAQFSQQQFFQTVQEVLIQTGLSPHRLELEVTETSLIDDRQHTLQVIRRLKAIGVKIAMDDFGTGYSSLATLQTFPFDKIKIDRAFVDTVITNPQSAAIVRATIILAHSLNIPVLAEGVEEADQLEFLRNEGCEEVQGFLFGRPVPLDDIAHLTQARLIDALPSEVTADERPKDEQPADEDGAAAQEPFEPPMLKHNAA